MQHVICECGFAFIIGTKRVFGPIMGDDASYARIMSRADFNEGYAHCRHYIFMGDETNAR